MAGNAAELRTALALVGFSANACRIITDAQDIDSVELLGELDDKEVESLCNTIRKPGGTTTNPAFIPAAPGQVQDPTVPAEIRDPGCKISNRAEKNLKLACYFVRHMIRTDRDYTATSITAMSLKELAPLRDAEDEHKDPDDLGKLDKIGKIRECLENIEHHLTQCLSASKVPLSYVIREDVVAPGGQDNNYATKALEMISRAPHSSNTFAGDNARVWGIIRNVVYDTDAYAWIKSFARSQNGRGAYLSLQTHYLGVTKSDNILTAAEAAMDTTFYTGEKHRFTFENYVTVHRKAHNDIQGIPGHEEIDGRTKVRKLLAGIRTTKLDAAIATIRTRVDLRANFDMSVDLLKTFIQEDRSASTYRIGSVDSGGRGGGGGSHHGGKGRGGRGRGRGRGDGGRYGRGRGGDYGRGRGRGRGGGRGHQGGRPAPGAGLAGAITDRYYTSEEYDQFTADQRNQLHQLRDARGHVGSVSRETGRNLNERQLAALDSMGQQLADATALALPPPPITGNRNNSALTQSSRARGAANLQVRFDPMTGARL